MKRIPPYKGRAGLKNAIPAYERLISLPLGEPVTSQGRLGPLAVDEVSNSFVQQKKNPHQSSIRFAVEASFPQGKPKGCK